MRVIHLTSGEGNGVDKACLMTAANMLIGRGKDGDHCHCVCPVIREFIIATNDLIAEYSEALLDELYTPLIWEILGTKADSETERKRGYYFADRAVRLFCPLMMEVYRWKEDADKLRNLMPITDKRSAITAAAACNATAMIIDYADGAIDGAMDGDALHAAIAAATTVTAIADACKDDGVFRLCPEVIRGAIAIGDKRPVETVMTHDQLAEVLR